MNNQKSNSYPELFLDENQTTPKPYEEISGTDTWKNMSGEERLEFIHKYIDPNYLKKRKILLHEPELEYRRSISDIRYKVKLPEESDDEKNQKIGLWLIKN
jgi:hypothetical protein